MMEAAQQHWSIRALERQIGKLYYERLLSSQNKAAVEQEASEQSKPLADQTKDYLHVPYMCPLLSILHQAREGLSSDLLQESIIVLSSQ